MKVTEEQKRTVVLYLLEKIRENRDGLSQHTAEVFHISPNTVHTYLNELLGKGIILREKRGKYSLAETEITVCLQRSLGELKNDTDALNKHLEPVIRDLAPSVRSIWQYAFSEMVNNVIDHSGAEHLWIRIRRNHLLTQVLLTDDGVGIFENIRNHFGFESLDDAICELFKGRLTTDAVHHSGEGIFFSSKMMDRFYILSGGKIFTTDKYEEKLISDMGGDRPEGTSVMMELSNFSCKKASETFDLYTNDDGGFTKTKIPLKNIFDSDPVSRSQARRVCNRLDKFTEVELDFDGVSWMGQGFAHQIFVVFRGEHPDIILNPINMGEDVESMYRHVIGSASLPG